VKQRPEGERNKCRHRHTKYKIKLGVNNTLLNVDGIVVLLLHKTLSMCLFNVIVSY